MQENVLHHLVSAKHCVKDIMQAVGQEAQIETYNQDQIAQAIDACWEGDEVCKRKDIFRKNFVKF